MHGGGGEGALDCATCLFTSTEAPFTHAFTQSHSIWPVHMRTGSCAHTLAPLHRGALAPLHSHHCITAPRAGPHGHRKHDRVARCALSAAEASGSDKDDPGYSYSHTPAHLLYTGYSYTLTLAHLIHSQTRTGPHGDGEHCVACGGRGL